MDDQSFPKKVTKKNLFLDGYGYIYWGGEKLGFISGVFRKGGLLEKARIRIVEALTQMETEGKTITIDDVEKVYDQLPDDYK